MALNRNDILKASDIKFEKVNVPQWGGDVMVYGMSGAERDSFEASVVNMYGLTPVTNVRNIRAKLCVLTIRDENGVRLFTDDDAAELGKKSADVLDRLFAISQHLSGISKADVEALAKNSESDPNEGSGSDLP